MNLNEMELNSIRETVTSHQTIANKLAAYSQNCQDAQIKQMFSQASQKSSKSAQKLTNMMN